MLKLILLASAVALITTTAGAQNIIWEKVPPQQPTTPTAVEDRSQQVHIKRSGTNERIDMYPGIIWRYEAPNARAIKHVHIGDDGLVFVQPGETDHVLYIGVFNKTGGNTGDNTGGNTGDKAGDNTGDNTGGKVGGETNVILLDADNELIANILIAAWPSYLREDEGL